jgi:transcriptional regulator with XRE-family HTH domain
MNVMSIGERIKQEMKKRGISQNRLAKAAQISQSGLSSIISGASSPKENTLQAIATALNISVPELIGNPQFPADKDEAWAIRERLRRDPAYRLLFNAADNASPEHLRAAAAMLKALEPKEGDGE